MVTNICALVQCDCGGTNGTAYLRGMKVSCHLTHVNDGAAACICAVKSKEREMSRQLGAHL